jgi:tousled-like kinase
MAPQSTINTTHQPVHSQDSNMSTGSSHSDKEVDPNTPEKVPRTPSERKRKRKADDSSGAPGKGVRNATSDKKINDYFKHSGNSPIRHGGAKSPSPQQPYPMVRKPSRFLEFPFPFYKNK